MRAVAHSPSFAKKVGIPQSVGKEFAAADKGKFMNPRARKFGGKVKKYSGADNQSVVKANEDRLMKTLDSPSVKPVRITPAPSKTPTAKDMAAMKAAKANEDALVKTLNSPGANMKRGGKVKKMAGGGSLEKSFLERAASSGALGLAPMAISKMAEEPEAPVEEEKKEKYEFRTMKKGGKVSKWEGSAKDEAQDKKLAKKHGMSMSKWESSSMDKKHDRQQSMKGLKSGGYCGGGSTKRVKMASGGSVRGDGCATRGKTKGRFC